MRSESFHLTKIFIYFADFAHAHTHAHMQASKQASKPAGLFSKVFLSTMHMCQTQFSEALFKMANDDHTYFSYWFT